MCDACCWRRFASKNFNKPVISSAAAQGYVQLWYVNFKNHSRVVFESSAKAGLHGFDWASAFGDELHDFEQVVSGNLSFIIVFHVCFHFLHGFECLAAFEFYQSLKGCSAFFRCYELAGFVVFFLVVVAVSFSPERVLSRNIQMCLPRAPSFPPPLGGALLFLPLLLACSSL